MGQELTCTGCFEKQTSPGKATLESDHVLFRGDIRVKILFSEIRSVEPREGWLAIASTQGTLALQLGAASEKWAHKILFPPLRLDKLGIEAGMRVSMVTLQDRVLAGEITTRGADLRARLSTGSDIILFGANEKSSLGRLEKLQLAIKPAGAIWIVYPKGVHVVTESDVLAAIRAAGLVDVKVVSFSATHTALKAIVPKNRRPRS